MGELIQFQKNQQKMRKSNKTSAYFRYDTSYVHYTTRYKFYTLDYTETGDIQDVKDTAKIGDEQLEDMVIQNDE